MVKTVIVHSLKQAVDVLTATAGLSCPVTLQNAPGSLHYAGSLYLRHMFMQAFEAVPDAKASYILDCGEDAALAANALRDGHTQLLVQTSPEMMEKLSSMATQRNAQIEANMPQALDIRGKYDIKAALKDWLLCD